MRRIPEIAGRGLHGWGATIRTVLAHEPDRFAQVPCKQLAILHRLGVEVVSSEQLVATPDSPTPDHAGPWVISGSCGCGISAAWGSPRHVFKTRPRHGIQLGRHRRVAGLRRCDDGGVQGMIAPRRTYGGAIT